MTYTTTKKQVYAQEEAQEFVAVGHLPLAAVGNASFIPLNASIEFDPDFQENERARTTFTKSKRTPGKTTGKMRVELELTASGSTATADPQFQLLLRACGLRSSDLTKVVFNGDIGTGDYIIRHGTMIEGVATPSGVATAMVIGDVHLPATPSAGSTVMWVGRQEGIGTGQLTVGDIDLTYQGAAAGSIASADIASVTGNAGTGFWPHSTPISKITFNATGLTSAIAAGDMIRGVTSGAFARVYKAVSGTAPFANQVVYIESPTGHFSNGEVVEHLTSGDTDIGTLAASGGADAQVSCPTISFGLNEDGIYSSFFGGRGTATFTAPSGRICKIAFEISGVYEDTSDVPFLEGITFNQRVPPTFKSSNFRLGPYADATDSTDQLSAAEYSPCVAQFQLQIGNNLTARECSNSSGGVLGYVIDDRNPKVIIDPEVVPEAGFGYITRLFSAEQTRGSLAVGATTPDRFVFGWPAGQVEQAPSAARGKILTRNITLGLNAGPIDTDTGDNEFWLIWQAG